MNELNATMLGVLLFLLGAAIFLLPLLLVRVVPRFRPTVNVAAQPVPLIFNSLPKHQEAVLIVQTGGRVSFLNQQAREWFNLNDQEPNLERLARGTRPTEALLSLCSNEGQTRLSLNGQILEATSYRVPMGAGTVTLVSLRRPQWIVPGQDQAGGSEQAGSTDQVFRALTELNKTISANLDLDATLRSILEGIEGLIPFDISEITIWDPENNFATPYRLIEPPGAQRRLEKLSERYAAGQGYSGYLIDRREPLRIGDIANFTEVKPASDRQRAGFRSFLGVPLVAAGELVGTLELASYKEDSFSENDQELLLIVAGQAAVALNNALLYEHEQKRARELAGLASLAKAVSVSREPHDLFDRLIAGIAPLLNASVLGFLLYDENRHTLEGQVPFLGLPANFVEWYQASFPANSPAEDLVQSLDAIVSQDAPQDERLKLLGLESVALAAGIRQTALVPLPSGGRMLGYMQVANKQDGAPFDRNDLHLMAIITGQVAPIIENVTLVQQARRRAQRAETLRRIASLISSGATVDEVLKYSLLDLARLLQADLAAIFLLDEQRGELRLHKASLFGVELEIANRLSRIPVDDPQFSLTVTSSQKQFTSPDVTESEILPLYRPLVDTLKFVSAIDMPLVARQRGIGEMMLGSYRKNSFTRGDILTAATAAGQLAAAIEQSWLYSQTDESLRQRVEQMTALTHISREINSSLNLNHLLKRVYAEVLRTTRADCGTILLFQIDEMTGTLPKISIHLGDPPGESLHPLEQIVFEHGESIIVADFSAAPDELAAQEWFPNLPAQSELIPPHADIRSALIVPIAFQGQVAGLIHLHARTPLRFDQAAREISEALAVQAAIALGNALRYQEQVQRSELLNRRVETLSKLFETSQALRSDQPLEQSLETIAYAIQTATPFEIVLISVYQPTDQTLQRLAGAGIPLPDMAELKTHPQPWASVNQLFDPQYAVGPAYFIAYERAPLIPADLHTLTLMPLETEPPAEDRWHSEDMLLLPLWDSQAQPLGLISVDAPRNGLRPDRPALETLEIFGSQAGVAIENYAHITGLKNQIGSIQAEIERVQQSVHEAQSQLPGLLHKDQEQIQKIQQLNQRARRLYAGLNISELVNRQTSRFDVLVTFGRELLGRMDLEFALIAEPVATGAENKRTASPRLISVLGDLSEEINPEALLGQRNPLRTSLQSGEMLLVADLAQASDWQNAPLLRALGAQAFICLPLMTEGRIDAAILAVSRSKQAAFTPEDGQLFKLLSQQVAAALHHLMLLQETQRRLREVNLLMEFSRQLGSLDPAFILRSLVESSMRVVLSADAAMVALWNDHLEQLVPQTALGYTDIQPMLRLNLKPGEGLPGRVFLDRQPLRVDEVEFTRDYDLSSDNLLRYRDGTAGRSPVACMLLPILGSTQTTPLGVLILENFQTPAAFSAEHQAIIASLTQQTALTLENARLYQAAEQRARQLQALTGVATTITSSLEPDELVATLLEQLDTILPHETGTLWLRQGERLVVQAARGFSESEQRIGLSVAVEDSQLLHEMVTTGLPISIADVSQDARFPGLIEYENLSWLGIPLIASGEVTGVIALEKAEANFYRREHLQIAAAFAGQAAVGLENAKLYQESVRRAQELDQRSRVLVMLNRLSSRLSGSLELNSILEYALQELSLVIRAATLSVILFDVNHTPRLLSEYPETGLENPLTLAEAPLFERLRQSLGVFYSEDASTESELEPLRDFLNARQTRSLLVLPLVTGAELQGLILAHVQQAYHFATEEVELGRTIANQVAIAVQNAQLFAETRSLTEDLELRVRERTTELAIEHRRTEILLRIITELSSSLDLDQVLNRTLHVLNEMIDAEQITVLIARPGEKRLHRLTSVGYTAPVNIGGSPTQFNLDQGLAGWVMTNRKPVLIHDLTQDPRWLPVEDPPLPHHSSAIAVPLMIGAEALGTLLLFHTETAHFSKDQLELVQAAGNQVAVAVNNAELYRLIRDQAEDLGSMLRNQQIETSRSRAILEAVADGVLVTDANRKITLFNFSAEKILGLDRSRVIGKSLEIFTGLFGKAAQAWREKIYTWSQNPEAYQAGDTYAEQITLEKGTVVAVRLAPVTLRNDFLGTVSIFQDITHQVEVDRLKSEFVATVSHELRTPMTSIKGYVEVLLMGAAGEMNDQQKHFLEIVKSNTERLGVLVNDLLDISRIEAGRVILSLQPLNMNEIAEEALQELQRRALEEDKPVQTSISSSPDLPRVMGDLDQVRQILFNLLDNAYHYNVPNGKVTIRMKPVDSDVQIDIVDTGMGIPAEDQPQVFERFFRGEGPLVMGVSGTGLGLSIVQNLVQMHHGRIWLESAGIPGQGSTFSFTLPVYRPEHPGLENHGPENSG